MSISRRAWIAGGGPAILLFGIATATDNISVAWAGVAWLGGTAAGLFSVLSYMRSKDTK